MSKHTTTFRFSGKASHPKNALALMYDLEGFSRFFNQPDVQDYVPTFLNHVSDAMARCLFGGDYYWLADSEKIAPLSFRVVHEKFTGDGALYIILPPAGESDFRTTTLSTLCNRLWTLKNKFDAVGKKALESVPVVGVPQRIRFGLSRGSVYELKRPKTTSREYIGFCINLASRLQRYCPDLGFIASARLMIPDDELTENKYRKVIATKVKGFPNELVIIDGNEYANLSDDVAKELFREVLMSLTMV